MREARWPQLSDAAVDDCSDAIELYDTMETLHNLHVLCSIEPQETVSGAQLLWLYHYYRAQERHARNVTSGLSESALTAELSAPGASCRCFGRALTL
jgi:hypothetical protein